MTRAQTVFVAALAVIALIIVVAGGYILSSSWWADRWYGRRQEDSPDRSVES